MEIRRLVRSGNSICITIPKKYLPSMGASIGDLMIMELRGKYLIFRKMTKNEEHMTYLENLP